jgi:nucleotide-binding universal stress UspA family protein
MLRSILIGIDLAGKDVAAQRLCLQWATKMSATLVGLAIVDEPGIRALEPAWPVGGKSGADPLYYMGYEARLESMHKKAEQLLEQFAARCDEAGVAHAEVKVVGSPHERIQEEAQTCDLIMLTRRSHLRFIAGDDEGDLTLRTVLKDTPRPMVVVPKNSWTDGPVVVAYDGSLQAARALAAFEATGLGKLGKVHVLSVGSGENTTSEHTDRACKFLGQHKVDTLVHTFSSSEPPEEVVLEQARRLNAGLLVMGAYGQTVLREFFVGSVTRKMLNESPVPLFLYH